MKLSVGMIIKCLGHKLKIVDIGKEARGVKRVHLCCAPGCCTNPNHLRINITDKHLIEALKDRKND